MERNSTDIEQAKMLKDAFKQIEPQNIEKILQEYIEIRNIYNAAIKEVRTKLEILDDEFNYRYKRNPIHSIQSRLKNPNSIISKFGASPHKAAEPPNKATQNKKNLFLPNTEQHQSVAGNNILHAIKNIVTIHKLSSFEIE
jgi:phage terminase small subunit